MDIKRAVGKRIKAVRQRNGLTQDQLAEQVGLSSKYISGRFQVPSATGE